MADILRLLAGLCCAVPLMLATGVYVGLLVVRDGGGE